VKEGQPSFQTDRTPSQAPGNSAQTKNAYRSGFRSWKKIGRVLRKIRGEPGLSEEKSHLFGHSLAASPDERWRLHENFLHSHDLFTRSSRKKYGFKSRA